MLSKTNRCPVTILGTNPGFDITLESREALKVSGIKCSVEVQESGLCWIHTNESGYTPALISDFQEGKIGEAARIELGHGVGMY